jgi:hypothetical protein
VEYGLFSGFFMNKFACRKKMPIDIFLIFCHDILAMILFRILTKSKGVHVLTVSYSLKPNLAGMVAQGGSLSKLCSQQFQRRRFKRDLLSKYA